MADTQVKRPSPEDVLDLEKELQRLIARKQAAEQHIVNLEARLYDLETEYYRETAVHGSLLKGLDGYHGLRPAQAQQPQQQHQFGGSSSSRRTNASAFVASAGGVVPDSDRVFSRTSASWARSVRLHRSVTGEQDDEDALDFEQEDLGGAAAAASAAMRVLTGGVAATTDEDVVFDDNQDDAYDDDEDENASRAAGSRRPTPKKKQRKPTSSSGSVPKKDPQKRKRH